MTEKERVICALNHEEPDFIPYQIDFASQEYSLTIESLRGKANLGEIENHIYSGQYGFSEEIKPGIFKNELGVIHSKGVVTEHIIKDIEDEFVFPPVCEKKTRKHIEDWISAAGDKFTIYGAGSIFSTAWSLYGMENLLADMLLNPEAVSRLFSNICEYDLSIMEIALEYELDGCFYADDWGQQKNLIMGADNFRKFIKPQIKKLYSIAKDKGLYVLQHSCGDIHELFPDLIEIGLDCYQTFQSEIYDIESVKKEFGASLSFWGGISTQSLLPYGTPEQVKDETIRTLKIMRPGGGYIAGPSHTVTHDVPTGNFMAMLEVFENQDKYL